MKKDLSRRRFLQRTAGAASALAANTLFLRDPRADAASYPAVAPSDRLRFGIIGIGMLSASPPRISTTAVTR